ncbi:cell division protein FtsQ/DivIB [uncultured Jatrophihabitans sp.]|uniref:cell division protein FtsQ/DivIB n=1 Tax=uncultured Jatrophihabitans sp. TaxID=1610747 RepID=UPI0035CC84B2
MSTTTPFLRPAGADHGDGDGDVGGAGDRPAPTSSRRRLRLLLAGGVVVVLALVVTWVVAFSALFGVRTVQVRGAHTLTATQVQQAARIAHGTPLVRLDTAAATRRVEALPDVSSAQVSTSFPSTVIVTVVERVPVGYLSTGGHDVLVDRTGNAYHALAAAPARLPKLVVPTGSAAASARAAVARVAAALPVRLRPDVRSIDALDPVAITLVLTKGRMAQWGSASSSEQKGRILPVLLAHAKHDTQFNVVDPQRPYSR